MRSFTVKLGLIMGLTACFMVPHFVQPPQAKAVWVELCVAVGSLIYTVCKEVAADQAKKAAQDAIRRAMKKTMVETLNDVLARRDYMSAIGIIGIMLLKWVADLLRLVNNTIYSFAFADLTVLFNYAQMVKHGTAAGKQIGKLYNGLAGLGMTLAAFFFMLSQGFNVFKLVAKKAWGDVFRPVARIFAALLLINVFPTIFSLSTTMTSHLSNQILSYKIPGEKMKHAPVGDIGNVEGAGFSMSPSTGLDLLVERVDAYLGMPEAVITRTVNAAGNYVDNTVDALENTFNAWVDSTVTKTVDTAIDKSLDAIASKIGVETSSGATVDTPTGPIKQGIDPQLVKAAIGYIFSAIMEISSLLLVVTLLSLKGLQMASLLILYLAAPLALAFWALPSRENLGLKFLTTVWGILGWNIFWAIAIKAYFIVALIVNSANSMDSAYADLGMTGIIPFAGAFVRMGILLAMVAVTSWVGIIAVTSVASSVGGAASMAGGFLSMNKIGSVASIVATPVTMAKSAGSAAMSGFTKSVGFLENPKQAIASHYNGFLDKANTSIQRNMDQGSGKNIRERLAFKQSQPQNNTSGKNQSPSPSKQMNAGINKRTPRG